LDGLSAAVGLKLGMVLSCSESGTMMAGSQAE
jgi:hypothetical protein